MVRTVIGIALAGAAGALARYGLEGVDSRRTTGLSLGEAMTVEDTDVTAMGCGHGRV